MNKPNATKRTLRIFWQYTKRYSLHFWTGTIGVILGVIAQGIIPPYIVSRAFVRLQAASAANHGLAMSDLLPYIVAYTISMVFGLIFWRVQSYSVWQYEMRVKRDIFVDVFDHLQHQSDRFHADRFGGALVSQTNKFSSAYERLMDDFTWSIMNGVTVIIASTGVLFFVAPLYAGILVAITALYLAIMSRRVRYQLPYNRQHAEAESSQTAALADAITNVGTIRAFGREDDELERFRKVAEHTHTSYRKLSIEVLKSEAASQSLTNSLRTTSFVFGVFAVISLGANVSALYLIVSYTIAVVDNLWQFSRVVRNVNRSLGDAAEMTEILGIQPEIVDQPAANMRHISRGEIVFDKVSFGFQEKKRSALFKDLSFKIKPGEKIGLVGHSGGGKTTITKLLLRFMDIQGGRILIDGQDIAKIPQSQLRQRIAYVSQEPMLFHRTLRENIGYDNKDATVREIAMVAKWAHAEDFIADLPEGYETLVGERGVKLSGGQRQRVAIARAMLKNAPILVLDEATSALDSESEALIQDALWRLMEGRTAIIIAHRLSTIQKMDRIIVLDKGKIVEQGSHKDLIRAGGTYAGLWNRQSGGFLED